MKKEYILNIVLLFSSLFMMIYVAELILAYTSYNYTESEFHAYQRVKKDESIKDLVPVFTPMENIVRARREGEALQFLPLGGVSNSHTIYCNESGFFSRYVSDEHGFHNPKGWSGKSAELVLIGDSFVQGACVKDGNELGALFRKKGFDVVSLGQAGSGPLIELATLREYGLALHPRVVLWFYFEGNDLSDLDLEFGTPLLANYLQGANQGLAYKQKKIDSYLRQIIKKEVESRKNKPSEKWTDGVLALRHLRQSVWLLLHDLKSRLKKVVNADKPEKLRSIEKKRLARFFRVLSLAKKDVESIGATIFLVYLPAWERYAKGDNSNLISHKVIAGARGLGIRVLDFRDVLKRQEDPLLFFPNRKRGHYNARGYKRLVDFIIQKTNGFNPVAIN